MAYKSLFALRMSVKGRTFFAGKVVSYRGKRVFFRTPAKDPVLHKWDAISIDARLIPKLENHKVTELHIEINDKLYCVDLATFKSNSVPGNHGDGDQLYLPTGEWAVRATYKPTFTTEVHDI